MEGDRRLIDLVLARTGSGEVAPAMALGQRAPAAVRRNLLVIADAGGPPGRGMDGIAHAGTLSWR